MMIFFVFCSFLTRTCFLFINAPENPQTMADTGSTDTMRRCFCSRCGGPDGPGALKPKSTYYRHTSKAKGAPEHGQQRRIQIPGISAPIQTTLAPPAPSLIQPTGTSSVDESDIGLGVDDFGLGIDDFEMDIPSPDVSLSYPQNLKKKHSNF